MRSTLVLLSTGLVAVITVTGCSDDGRAATGSSSGSVGSASGSEASASAARPVPGGVAAQYATLEQEIAAEGGDVTIGPWRIAYIVEPAEPWYHGHADHQMFRQPARDETHHLEIIPVERSTGRIVPEVPISLDVVDAQGTVVDTKDLKFYYSEFFHYANNFEVPEAGTYRLRAHVEAPTFLRHGEQTDAPALTKGATVTFPGVHLDTSE